MSDVTLQDARDQLGRLLTRTADTGEAVMITRYGRPEAVLVSTGAYDELQELRRERDRRVLAELTEADTRGDLAWVPSAAASATTSEELLAGLDEDLNL